MNVEIDHRLRRKRLDAAYLARDRGRNASRMGSIRRRRRAAGQCGDCDAIAVGAAITPHAEPPSGIEMTRTSSSAPP